MKIKEKIRGQMEDLPPKYKVILRYGVLILKVILIYSLMMLMVYLMSNNNHNPNSFIERIFRPIRFYNGMIHYAGIIPLVGIYYLIKQLYRMTDHTWLTTRMKRIIVTIIVINLLLPIANDQLNTYRSWQKGIEAITVDREDMNLNIEIGEEGSKPINLSGWMVLTNYGNEEAIFQIKVILPKAIKEITGEEYLDIEEVYQIGAKAKEKIYFEKDLMKDIHKIQEVDEESGELSGEYRIYEFIIYNDQDEVLFEASYSDKYFHLDAPHF